MAYDFDQRSKDSGITFDPKESVTRTEFASQCNINNIIKKYVKNGNNPFVITQDAKYGDFTNVPSHQEALDYIIRAEEHFLQLPASLRTRFQNDPSQMIDFLTNEENREEAIKLGLVQKLDNIIEKNSPAEPAVKDPEGVSKP